MIKYLMDFKKWNLISSFNDFSFENQLSHIIRFNTKQENIEKLNIRVGFSGIEKMVTPLSLSASNHGNILTAFYVDQNDQQFFIHIRVEVINYIQSLQAPTFFEVFSKGDVDQSSLDQEEMSNLEFKRRIAREIENIESSVGFSVLLNRLPIEELDLLQKHQLLVLLAQLKVVIEDIKSDQLGRDSLINLQEIRIGKGTENFELKDGILLIDVTLNPLKASKVKKLLTSRILSLL